MNTIRNKVQLIGYLGQDPEVKEYADGKKVANMSIATNENSRDDNGKKVTDTQWHTVVAWGKLAEIAEKYLLKGIELAIVGKLVNRHYIDNKGAKHYVTEVQAQELLIITKKAE